jgi:hypothetical protein
MPSMSLIQINHHPTRRQLAVFGLTWLVFFAILASGVTSRGGSPTASMTLWAAALIVPGIGWVSPEFLRWVYLGMSYLALPIGLVVSHVVLAVVWYLVFTPVGLLMRLVGYDPLDRRFDRDAPTYWVARAPMRDVRRYFRQF